MSSSNKFWKKYLLRNIKYPVFPYVKINMVVSVELCPQKRFFEVLTTCTSECDLTGNRVLVDAISSVKMRPSWSSMGPSSNMTGVVFKRRKEHTQRGECHVPAQKRRGTRWPCADRGRDWNDASTSRIIPTQDSLYR